MNFSKISLLLCCVVSIPMFGKNDTNETAREYLQRKTAHAEKRLEKIETKSMQKAETLSSNAETLLPELKILNEVLIAQQIAEEMLIEATPYLIRKGILDRIQGCMNDMQNSSVFSENELVNTCLKKMDDFLKEQYKDSKISVYRIIAQKEFKTIKRRINRHLTSSQEKSKD